MMEIIGKPDKDINESMKHICDVVQKRIDEAYQRGLKDGKEYGLDESDMREAVSYQRGLDDAWAAARKIVFDSKEGGIRLLDFPTIFGNGTIQQVFRKNSAAEAIEKLKAYEEKQNDKIEVGDEVLWFMKGDDEGCDDIMDVCDPSVVTMVPNKECDDYTIIESSGAMTVISKEQIYKKTGRHFDIDKILEDMRND
jgi:hypothetical protein